MVLTLRPPKPADRDTIVTLWESQRGKPDSCWCDAEAMTSQKIERRIGRCILVAVDDKDTLQGALFVWDLTINPAVALLSASDDACFALAAAALQLAADLGGTHVTAHVPERAADTRRQLAPWPGISWDNRGGFAALTADKSPSDRRAVHTWVTATVAETLPALQRSNAAEREGVH